jgi:hypothetical protein
MTRTSLVWHNGEDTNFADGWNDEGQPRPHDKRSKVRAAGSMNTTISDLSKFTAALVRGDGLSGASRAEITRPVLHIATASLFPLFLPDLPPTEQCKDLYSGLASSSSMVRTDAASTRVVMMARRPTRWSALRGVKVAC